MRTRVTFSTSVYQANGNALSVFHCSKSSHIVSRHVTQHHDNVNAHS